MPHTHPHLGKKQPAQRVCDVMPRDPVCGVRLDEKTARYKIKHEGETYYFCSVKCKKKFKRHRRKFVK